MELLKPSMLSSELLNSGQNRMPLIICTDAPRVKKKLDEAGYKEYQINIHLSKRLLDYQQNVRPSYVEGTLKELLDNSEPVLITEFEMLFDPRYELDVLKFFSDEARLFNVAVKWPGKFSENRLTYANPGDPDYHEFDCNTYQIRIVQ